MLRFFLKAFLLSFTAIAFSWFFEGAFYAFRYSRADDVLTGELSLPQPAIVQNIIKDTNFLLLGMAGKPYPAPYLTDTIIVGSFRTSPQKLALISIPRDLLVQVPGGENYVKINSLYEIGRSFSPLEPETFINQKIAQITGMPLEYTALIDVEGLESIIDFLGGVDIEVKESIADPFYPGPNYSYEPFYLETGIHHLDGHDAVRFARSRYAPRGDFERIERQHHLLEALRKTILAREVSLEHTITMFTKLKDHFATNASVKDLPSILATLLTLDDKDINMFTLGIGVDGLLREERTQIGAWVLIPKAGLEKYGEIQEFFQKFTNSL